MKRGEKTQRSSMLYRYFTMFVVYEEPRNQRRFIVVMSTDWTSSSNFSMQSVMSSTPTCGGRQRAKKSQKTHTQTHVGY